jgi:hypothetical protein
MNLERRLNLLSNLAEYLSKPDAAWLEVKEKVANENPWFIPEFIDFQVSHIANEYLNDAKLREWLGRYKVPAERASPKKVGIVMAGNIPLAGFHDFLAAFLSGHRQFIKPSSKDHQLIKAVVDKLVDWDNEVKSVVTIAEHLKGCDAYIATGSNNSSRYFDYYFGKYPHIIRRNRTSVAILSGNETLDDLCALADDIYIYFGLGCRNVTKLFVPKNYDFLPLLEAFRKYNWVFEMHKYRNNYDYQLAVMIINKLYYMTNGSLLLQENKSLFSPISQLHYEYYSDMDEIEEIASKSPDVQCIVSQKHVPFGFAQRPRLNDYADKADTLQFLLDL